MTHRTDRGGVSCGTRTTVLGRGERLEAPLRRWLEGCFGEDLSHVRVHTDMAAARITARAGAVALAHGRDLLFGEGAFAPDTDAGRRVLAHEVAHVLQQRRVRTSDPARAPLSAAQLEAEANAAARSAASGRPFHVAPAPGCPDWQPLAWFVVLGLMAAAGIGYALLSDGDDIEEDAADPNEHLYETWWGYIPFVGSISEVMSGRSRFERGVGAAFLVLDCTLVGGAVVKGLFGPVLRRGAAKVGLTSLEKSAQKKAFEAIVKAGGTVGTKEEVAKAIVSSVAGTGKAVVVTSSEGWLNHSVSWVIKAGEVWRMEGGPLKLFFNYTKKEGAEEAAKKILADGASSFVAKANAMSIFYVEEQVTTTALEWWRKELTQNILTLFWKAEGCAGSQALLLKQVGQKVGGDFVTSRLLNPLLPFFLNAERLGATAGTHLISGSGRLMVKELTGSLAQLGLWAVPRGGTWFGAGIVETVVTGQPSGKGKVVAETAQGAVDFGKSVLRGIGDLFSDAGAGSQGSGEIPMDKFAAHVLDSIPPYEAIDGLILDRINLIDFALGLSESALPYPMPRRRPPSQTQPIGVSGEVVKALAERRGGSGKGGDGGGSKAVTEADLAAAAGEAALTYSIKEDMEKVLKVAKELQLKNRATFVLFDEIYSRAGLPTRRAILATVALDRAGMLKVTYEGKKEGLPCPREVRVAGALRTN